MAFRPHGQIFPAFAHARLYGYPNNVAARKSCVSLDVCDAGAMPNTVPRFRRAANRRPSTRNPQALCREAGRASPCFTLQWCEETAGWSERARHALPSKAIISRATERGSFRSSSSHKNPWHAGEHFTISSRALAKRAFHVLSSPCKCALCTSGSSRVPR
jgi:hypothetical protein